MNYKVIFLFFFLLLVFNVNAQIIDERTENNCNSSGICTWEQTMGKRFHEHEGEFLYFNEYIDSASISNIIGQNTLTGTQVSLMPIVTISNTNYQLADVPSLIGNQMNFQTFVNNHRDETEFRVNLNMVNRLNRIGYRVVSNQPIRYIDYNYTPSGVYEVENAVSINPFGTPTKPIPIYEMTDLLIGDLQYSFIDLIEDGYNATYDKETDTLWIDLTGYKGNIDIDPLYNFYSDNADALIAIDNSICQNNPLGQSLTVIEIGADRRVFGSSITFIGFFMFDTSSLPDEDYGYLASIVKVYAHSYSITKRLSITLNVNGYTGKTNITNLNCTTAGEVTTYQSTLNWNRATGYKTYFLGDESNINTTGWTNFKALDTWSVGTGQHALVGIRTSEYAGVTTDPLLQVLYEPPVVETVTIEEEGYWFMGMMLNVMFFVGFLSVYYLKKYKNEWE